MIKNYFKRKFLPQKITMQLKTGLKTALSILIFFKYIA